MKKLLLTAAFAIMSFAAFAQDAPDASTWKVGDDVSEAVNFGNLSFESDPMDYWTFKSSKGSTTTKGGLFEVYDGADCDLYQYLYLPAGMYELNCQGYYRFGTSWDVDPNSYANGTWENLSKLYAEAGTYDIDSEEFIGSGSSFSNPLMPRLFEGVMDRLFEDLDYEKDAEGNPVLDENGNKKFNAGWDMSDGQYNQVGGCWGPCSVPGSLVWFAENKYLPFESDEDETVYNKVTFFVTEASWVKVGVQKIEVKSADSFMATNFHLIYKGTADDAAKIALAYKAMEIAQKKAENLAEEIMADYPALGSLLQDAVMDLTYDDTTVEGVESATAAFNELFTNYTQFYADAKKLTTAIAAMEELAAATDYDGKDAFVAAIDAATIIATAEDYSVVSNPEVYAEAYEALTEARGAYVLTRPAVDGVYNYSDLINQPFFCNNEYNPTWDEDLQQYIFNAEIESTWATIREQGYSEAAGEHADWIPFCSNVTIASSGNDEGRWVINSTTWHGGGPASVTLQHGYPAVGGWTAEPSGNPELLHQTIVNLPNGYYSMSALMCNVQTISDLQYVYIEGTDGAQEKANLTMGAQGWWGGWSRNSVWEKLETGMVQVTDGKVTIGSSSDSFYAVTGFQLYYYGEEPDFTAMIQKKLVAVDEKSEELTFLGDIAYVDGLLSSIPETITGFDAYDAANRAIAEAEDYIQKAVNATNNSYYSLSADYDKLFDKYNNPDAEGYIDGPTQSDILMKPMLYVAELGTKEKDVYTDIAKAREVFNAYQSYLNAYDRASVLDDADLKVMLEEQVADLKANYSNVETLNRYATEINFFIQKGAIIAAGGKNASETNPVDITSLIVNPDFTYSPSSGWSGNRGTSNEYARGNSEIWNVNPIDMYQIIQGLPEGKYELRVRALYRDARNVRDNSNQSWTSYWTVADGDVDAWERHFAELYASVGDSESEDYIESAAYLKSVCDGKFTEPSFTRYYRNNNNDLVEGDYDPETETTAIDTIWTYAVPEDDLYDENDEIITSKDGYTLVQDGPTGRYLFQDDNGISKFAWQIENTYPFDERIETEEGVFYYPSSMLGTASRFKLNPEAYCNKVQIEVPAGSNLRIGFRKSTQVEGDWIIFDDFQLFYLGGDLEKKPDTGVRDILDNNTKNTVIYNLAGQRINALQKGLNIVDGKKVLVK